MKDAAEIVEILLPERVGEAQALADSLEEHLRTARPAEHGGRVFRRHEVGNEHQRPDRPESDHALGSAADQIRGHGSSMKGGAAKLASSRDAGPIRAGSSAIPAYKFVRCGLCGALSGSRCSARQRLNGWRRACGSRSAGARGTSGTSPASLPHAMDRGGRWCGRALRNGLWWALEHGPVDLRPLGTHAVAAGCRDDRRL